MSTPVGGGLLQLPEPKAETLEQRVNTLETELATVIWLHAELAYSWRLAMATQIAAQLGPQMQQEIIDKIMSGGS